MSNYTGIQLIGPNGEDTFNLKINGEINIDIIKNVITDTLSASPNELVGTDIHISRRTYTIQGTVANMTYDDFPDIYNLEEDNVNPNHAYAYTLERVATDWGTVITGTSTIEWERGGINQTITGSISELDMNIVPSSENNFDQYNFTIEFSELDLQF